MARKTVVAISAAVVALALSPLGACSPQIHDASGGAGGARDTTTIFTSTNSPTIEVGGGPTTTETTITTPTTTTTTTTPADCGGLASQIIEPCRDCAIANCCTEVAACDVGTDCYNHLACVEQGTESAAECDAMYPNGKASNDALFNCLDMSCPTECGMN